MRYKIIQGRQELDMKIEPCKEIVGDTYNISEWLKSDVPRLGDGYVEQIESILEDNNSNREELLFGNAFKTYVKKDFTCIRWIFEDEMDVKPTTLPTSMLLEILRIWEKAKEDWRRKYGETK